MRPRRLACSAISLMLCGLFLLPSAASATVPNQQIISSGPLEEITLGNEQRRPDRNWMPG